MNNDEFKRILLISSLILEKKSLSGVVSDFRNKVLLKTRVSIKSGSRPVIGSRILQVDKIGLKMLECDATL